ncbi:AfsR/SARP family transcriptional regulator [Nonomuraea sp. SBT364]|uniref:AfsR/SARP family transcriptional regulator n=1 Tax=Nonomuraea sp. SBT364 TaxID=1580530 RepID=UPI00066E83A5|nr:BTAD domain-containing putative transcriptional regulator [Nonomuraea sp. SBT364]
MSIRFSLLGPVQVKRDGRECRIGSAKVRVLLTALLLEPNQLVSLQRLFGVLWDGEPPASAIANVRTYASRLRKLLDHQDRLVTKYGGYALRIEEGELDVADFREAAAKGRLAVRAGAAGQAAGHFRKALARWRGEPAEDLAITWTLRPSLDALADQRCQVMEELIEALLLTGDFRLAVSHAYDAVSLRPTRERFWALLMRARHQAGDSLGALSDYRQARKVLGDELGVGPGPELVALHRAILNGEAPLGVRSPATPLPPPIVGGPLYGREAELAELTSMLVGAEPGEAIVLHGAVGVGKSELARHALLAAAADRPLQFRLIDLACNAPPMREERALAPLHDDGEGLPQLILLDNITDIRQVRPVQAAYPSAAIAVTSRSPLAGLSRSRHLAIHRLPAAASVALLTALLTSAPFPTLERSGHERALLHQIADLCEHLPLALHLAARNIAVRRYGSLHGYVRLLADPRYRLDMLTCDDLSLRDELRGGLTQIEQNGSALDTAARSLLLRMGQGSLALYSPSRAAHLLDADLAYGTAALWRLAELWFLEPIGGEHYRLSELTRLFARELTPLNPL